MFAIQKIARRTPQLLKLTENQRRTFLVTPPRVRVSFLEKMALGVVFYIGIMTVPIYVVLNVKNYNARHKEE
ncbi:PREDICTED: uncharacterized protein LOC108571619 [Habropoda laboriosa]|uniref:uncharacterized protein LOC108571619 n=1 Tax=Habropoda laboriosa TaxID=597456 RepID=UPI00083CBF19|nr:PREDICTED: uncharacterized protein LOC108571619 [Habropoda laboriosa]